MEQTSKPIIKTKRLFVLLTVLAVFFIFWAVALWTCYQTAKAERHVFYVGMMDLASEKIAKTVRGMEMNAKNVFDEVEKHLDSPESVIAALESKTSLNPEVRGYFAAFEPHYFQQMGQWFEPYVHHIDSSAFECRQVGSERHQYHNSAWYVRAKESNDSFWSDPYYYNDGTSISGHYTTYVKPVFDKEGRLACVCGADMTFEWLAKELQRIDEESRRNLQQNKFFLLDEPDYYTVVINHDGCCIATNPEGKAVTLTKEQASHSMEQRKSGTIDLLVNGIPSTVYYAPINHVDWSVAVVVSNQNAMQPLVRLGFIFLLLTVMGMGLVWLVCRRVMK